MLQDVAQVRIEEGPPMLRSENARFCGWVYVDVRGRDLRSVVQTGRGHGHGDAAQHTRAAIERRRVEAEKKPLEALEARKVKIRDEVFALSERPSACERRRTFAPWLPP